LEHIVALIGGGEERNACKILVGRPEARRLAWKSWTCMEGMI
jgi:hypothetical protein